MGHYDESAAGASTAPPPDDETVRARPPVVGARLEVLSPDEVTLRACFALALWGAQPPSPNDETVRAPGSLASSVVTGKEMKQLR